MSPSTGVENVRLRDLRAHAYGTAAGQVPLLLFHDLVEGGWPSRIRHADFHSLYIAERGRGFHVIDRRRYGISRGDVYVMAKGSDHAFESGEALSLTAIHFAPTVLNRATWEGLAAVPGFVALQPEHTAGRRLHLSPAAYSEVAGDLAELWAEWRSGDVAGALLVRTTFLRLLARLARFAGGERAPLLGRPSPTPHREEVVAAAVRTIDLEYSERIRVTDLAAAAHLSPDRFTEVFASVMGRTPRDYIHHVRLEHAKTLLAATAIPISDIARTSGFGDSAYFARSFRAATGLSPRSYR